MTFGTFPRFVAASGAANLADGIAVLETAPAEGEPERITFSENFACPVSGFTIPEIEPRLFSFNNPFGACPACTGIGTELEVDPELVVPDEDLTLEEGAIAPWAAGTQSAVEAAKTTATVTGVSTRTGIEATAQGTLSGVKAADVAVHTGAEAAKTGATVAGAATRTATEAAASTAAKGFSISTALTEPPAMKSAAVLMPNVAELHATFMSKAKPSMPRAC